MAQALTRFAAMPAMHSLPEQMLTLQLGTQWFAIAVAQVREVIHAQPLTPIPLTPTTVAGSFLWRGEIVTALDAASIMEVPSRTAPEKTMMVVVHYQQDCFALMVDAVGEVVPMARKPFEKPPSAEVGTIAAGLFKHGQTWVVMLNVARMIEQLVKEQP